MKIRYFALALLCLMLVGSVSAAESSISGHSFTVPDDYNVIFEDDSQVIMQMDLDHIIFLGYPQVNKSLDEYLKNFEKMGNKLLDENNYTHGQFDVNEYTFNDGEYNVMFYHLDDGDDTFIINFAYPKDESRSESFNPVITILDSLN